MDSINDSEIQIPGFSIVRCDRLLREGGGVCIYVRNTKSFSVCLNYSNSICDLLIVKLHQLSLIIILMYRPPTCPITEFNNIILKTKSYIMSIYKVVIGNLIFVLWLFCYVYKNLHDHYIVCVHVSLLRL